MLAMKIGEIREEDLIALVESQVVESRTIEYKQQLPKKTPSAKREFLRDVSSFANASGGDLIFGIVEDPKSGAAKSVEGLSTENVDQEKSRLGNLVRDGIEPQIWGIDMQPVRLSNSRMALVVRIPRSWSMPHRVSLGGLNKFYSRNANGKYEMDVAELRVAFTLTETAAERIRRFREDRVSRAFADETPVPLREPAKTVLHLVSISSFQPGRAYDIDRIASHAQRMTPINAAAGYARYNFDGLLTSSDRSEQRPYSYVQLFRNGIIEAVDISLVGPSSLGQVIPATGFERQLIHSVRQYLGVLRDLDVELPVFLFLSLLGVQGYSISRKPVSPDAATARSPGESETIDRDCLLVPEVILDSYNAAANKAATGKALRACFDPVWQACGWRGSLNYNNDGEWAPP